MLPKKRKRKPKNVDYNQTTLREHVKDFGSMAQTRNEKPFPFVPFPVLPLQYMQRQQQQQQQHKRQQQLPSGIHLQSTQVQ